MPQTTKPTPMTVVGKRDRWKDNSTNITMLKALAYRVDWLLKHHVGRDNLLEVFDEVEAEEEGKQQGDCIESVMSNTLGS